LGRADRARDRKAAAASPAPEDPSEKVSGEPPAQPSEGPLPRRDLWIAAGLLLLWALLYLPNLRSNPNWYGDEGEWMDASWTLAQGHPRVDATVNDFLFPYPYPPLYLAINGTLLKLFGNDLIVGRSLGAATALGIAALLVWIGRRLVDRSFGFLCAAAFLVYPEAVINFRWARGHTLCGLFVTASIGFLVRYVQEARLRDVLLAGAMCSLAIATTYWSWSLAGAVVLTALFVNRRHAAAAVLASLGYLALFLVGYGLLHDGGFPHLKEQLARLYLLANGNDPSPFFEELALDVRYLATFLFGTSTAGGWPDLWLIVASVGIACLGAAMEITLEIAYLTAQGFGWNWSENQRPLDEARFSATYIIAILAGMLPILVGIDPLTLTIFGMALTAATLPVSIVPFLFLMNDYSYVRVYRNGWLSNAVVLVIIGLAFVLAIVAIPLQIFGGS